MFDDGVSGGLVQAGGGLVEDEDAGPCQQDPRERDAAALTAGDFGGEPPEESPVGGQAEQFQGVGAGAGVGLDSGVLGEFAHEPPDPVGGGQRAGRVLAQAADGSP